MNPQIATWVDQPKPSIFRRLDSPSVNIFRGKSRRISEPKSKRLRIKFLIYDTLVTGISTATDHNDFCGVTSINYTHQNQEYTMVFAMWYSQSEQRYFLMSLGQFSPLLIRRDIENFKGKNRNHFKIRLNPIHPDGLENLDNKLQRTNILRANVCIVENAVE